MFGDAMLVAPKISEPDYELAGLEMQSTNYYLPIDTYWYNGETKLLELGDGSITETLLGDL